MSQINTDRGIEEANWPNMSPEQITAHFSRFCRHVPLSDIAAREEAEKEAKKLAATKKRADAVLAKEAKEKERALLAGMSDADRKLYRRKKKLEKQMAENNEPKLDL